MIRAFLLLILVCSAPGIAHAANAANPVKQAAQSCVITAREMQQGIGPYANKVEFQQAFTVPIIVCFTKVVNAVSRGYVTHLRDRLKQGTLAFMTLAVIFYSLKLIMGGYAGGDAKKDIIILMLKMMIIVYFIFQLEIVRYYNIIQRANAEVSESLFSSLGFKAYVIDNQSFANRNRQVGGSNEKPEYQIWEIKVPVGASPNDPYNLQPNKNATLAAAAPGDDPLLDTLEVPGGRVWFMVDKIIRMLLNFENALTAGVGGLAVIGAIWAASKFFSFGAIMILFILANILSLIVAFARCIHIYIVTMMALMILLAISPLILPLILFRWGMDIFNQWLKQVLSYSMQPIILTVFLAFMLCIFYSVLFDLREIYFAMQQHIEYQSMAVTNNTRIPSNLPGTNPQSSSVVELFAGGTGGNIKEMLFTTAGIAKEAIMLPMMKVPADLRSEYLCTLILGLLLFLIMIGFLRSLPDLTKNLAGAGDTMVKNFTAIAGQGYQKGLSGLLNNIT